MKSVENRDRVKPSIMVEILSNITLECRSLLRGCNTEFLGDNFISFKQNLTQSASP